MNNINFEKESRDWSRQTITNSFMFNKVFTNNPDTCRQLLEILLGLKIERIEKPQGEYLIEGSIENHAVRFDVYTEDENHIYDIEMQTSFETDLPERSRYYQSMMDTDSLKAGKPYKALKDSVVIFICTFDPFGKKKAKYEFKNLDTADGSELCDRTKKLFFNVKEYDKIKGNEELKGLLQYFCNSKTETDFTGSLSELVKIAQKNERWRQDYMTYERWEYYTKQAGIREGEAAGYEEGIAHQKAKDEKLLAEKETENARLADEIQVLKAQIAELSRGQNSGASPIN